MSDLIELRKHYCDDASCEVMRNEAADEIERLKGDIQILKLQRDATHVSRCPRCAALEDDDE